jgi:uncharacterized membrane protein
MSKYPLNDLCEACGVMDGITVVGDQFVCYRCAKKLKKLKKKGGRNEQYQRV